jgi:hypothetical protein
MMEKRFFTFQKNHFQTSIEGLDPGVQNYIFMGIVGIIFLIWYIGIRGFILKKKMLKNSY